MTTTTCYSMTSAQYASNLLDAWNQGDLRRLERELDDASVANRSSKGFGLEEERRDLLDGIVQQMKSSVRDLDSARGTCNIEVSLRLLRHLKNAPSF